ncbi:hypothetical protein MJD09_07610 [bacterium]|nr:hypothetical protein [bacterium]
MIEFEDQASLVWKIRNAIRLIRALANFHVEKNERIDADELNNQRIQLLRAAKELSLTFEALVDLLKEAADFKEVDNHESDSGEAEDLVTKLIKKSVPEEMQKQWDPENFSGSLLVFFEHGSVESASLIEKKVEDGEEEHIVNDFDANLLARQLANTGDVEVVTESEEPLTIVQSREDSMIHFYFTLKEPAAVTLRIYNQMDQLIRELHATYDRPGDYIIKWDGLDDEGKPAPKERYFCQLQAGAVNYEVKSINLT